MNVKYINKKKKYSLGDRSYSLVLIKELGYKNGKRLGLFKCDCGRHKIIKINDVLAKRFYPTKSCGCQIYKIKLKTKKKYLINKKEQINYCLNCKKTECDNCLS